MSDLSQYRNQVTELGKRAVAAEQSKDYQVAYENYVAALNIFKHLIKCKFLFIVFLICQFRWEKSKSQDRLRWKNEAISW